MAASGWLMVTVGPVQFRHEVPREVDLSVRRWKNSLPGGFSRAQAEVCQECPLFRRTTPEECCRVQATQSHINATSKPYTRHILRSTRAPQSHLKATPRLPQGHPKPEIANGRSQMANAKPQTTSQGQGGEHQSGGMVQNRCSGSNFDNSFLYLRVHPKHG